MMKIVLLVLLSLSSLTIAQNTSTQKIQNDYLLAENYYREGAYEKASQLFKKLYESSTFNTQYLGRLISCYQETSKFLMVEKILLNRLEKNKSQAYLYVYLGYNYERQLQLKKANENYILALSSLEKKNSIWWRYWTAFQRI